MAHPATRLVFAPVLLLLTGAAAGVPEPARPPIDLPVRDVTVFSDRARVVRRGEVRIDAPIVRLPILPATVDPDSIRLEATGARVVRVEVQRAEKDEFPRAEAEELLKTLERLRDEAAVIGDGLQSIEEERGIVRSIRPSSKPNEDPLKAPLLLEPAGWKLSLQFLDGREAALSDALLPLEQKLRDKEKEIRKAVERAEQIAAGDTGQPGYKVDAILDGKGRAQLALTYISRTARWYPAYDVRYAPGEAHVQVDFAGLVSQETGEDWKEARLVLSTAIPATTATLPKLAVWKIGDKDRFIPTPVPEYQPPLPRPPPPPPPGPPIPLAILSDEELRESLMAAAEQAQEAAQPERPAADGIRGIGGLGARGRGAGSLAGALRAPSESPPGARAHPSAPPPPPPRAMPQALEESKRAEIRSRRSMSESYESDTTSISQAVGSFFGKSDEPTESVGFGAPRGWRPPSYAADLPAALAGGYDFTFASARPETIRSGAQAVKVALHSERFPAEVTVRIWPALRKDAYLVADLKNSSSRPLLQGRAQLFVGADLVGEATFPTTAPGEKVPVPLGIDEAIRVERNVQVVASQRGFFSKQDLTAYETVIELMNPRARTVKAVVVDQMALPQGKDIEVVLEKSDPAPEVDKVEGLLEWKLDLAQGVKKKLSFTYSIARPKDARLGQSTAPIGGR